LAKGLAQLGHSLTFFERDVPYYGAYRDYTELPNGRLSLYRTWEEVCAEAATELALADAGIVTSYCHDAAVATRVLFESPVPVRAFYDLDTPVTLARLEAGESVDYLPSEGLGGFDVVLSFTGGAALQELQTRLGARHTVPLYGGVDPQTHRPVPPEARFAAHLSYLGTYSADRQRALEALLLAAAAALPNRRFLLGGSLYPTDFPWSTNLFYFPHVAPPEHPAFYCSSPLTLNVTRGPMVAMGWCPSGRIFEAAACGVPVLSDVWSGLEDFFEPGNEILLAQDTEQAIDILSRPTSELSRIGEAARKRTLNEHTGVVRARQLIEALDGAPQVTASNNVVTQSTREMTQCGE
jgi:spore maturation protein CgeB